MVDEPGYTEHEYDGLPRYKPKAKPGEWDMSLRQRIFYSLAPVFVLTALASIALIVLQVI
jgi:hypothetical protein